MAKSKSLINDESSIYCRTYRPYYVAHNERYVGTPERTWFLQEIYDNRDFNTNMTGRPSSTWLWGRKDDFQKKRPDSFAYGDSQKQPFGAFMDKFSVYAHREYRKLLRNA